MRGYRHCCCSSGYSGRGPNGGSEGSPVPVSYTHLDVYKRQGLEHPAADGYNGQFTVVYKESTIPLKGAPVNAGSYTVTVTPADPGFAGEWNGSFVIRRIPATVRAADASMTAGGPEPEYQLEVTGFVNGEMISDVSFDSSAVDRSTAGTYEAVSYTHLDVYKRQR